MYKKAIIIHLVVLSVSAMFSSCCETNFTVTPDFSVSFTDLQNEVVISPSQDTITGPFAYSLISEVIGDNSHHGGLNLMHTANAFQCDEVYENAYRRETASLVLDKPFLLDGNTIAAGTNLLD